MLRLANYLLLSLAIGFSFFIAVYFFTPGHAYPGIGVPGREGLISRFTKPVEVKESFDRLEKISAEKIRFPVITSDGSGILYYDQRSGYIHRIDLSANGFPDILLQKLRTGLTDLHWSRNMSFVWGKNIDHIVFYDLISGKSSEFDPAIKSFDVSPDESHWSYFTATGNGYGDIFVSAPLFLSPQRLVGVSGADWSTRWVNNDSVALYFQSENKKSLFISSTSMAEQNLKRIIADKIMLSALWSPDGKSLIYSFLSDSGNESLYYLGPATNTAMQLAIETSVPLCGWSSEHLVICAVPRETGTDKLIFSRLVDFYKIKTNNSTPPELIKTQSATDVAVEKILLSPDGQSIYFENLLDGNFYRLLLN